MGVVNIIVIVIAIISIKIIIIIAIIVVIVVIIIRLLLNAGQGSGCCVSPTRDPTCRVAFGFYYFFRGKHFFIIFLGFIFGIFLKFV